MDDDGRGKACPEPSQAEIHTIELQYRAPRCSVDQGLHIGLHARRMEALVHEQMLAGPAFVVIAAQMREVLVLTPVLAGAQMRRIDSIAMRRGIEPAALVERLVIGGTAGDVTKQIPEERGAGSKPRRDENGSPTGVVVANRASELRIDRVAEMAVHAAGGNPAGLPRLPVPAIRRPPAALLRSRAACERTTVWPGEASRERVRAS